MEQSIEARADTLASSQCFMGIVVPEGPGSTWVRGLMNEWSLGEHGESGHPGKSTGSMGDTSSLRIRSSHCEAFGGVEVLQPGERYRPQEKQIRLASPHFGSLTAVCLHGEPVGKGDQCALIFWCHGPPLADA